MSHSQARSPGSAAAAAAPRPAAAQGDGRRGGRHAARAGGVRRRRGHHHAPLPAHPDRQQPAGGADPDPAQAGRRPGLHLPGGPGQQPRRARPGRAAGPRQDARAPRRLRHDLPAVPRPAGDPAGRRQRPRRRRGLGPVAHRRQGRGQARPAHPDRPQREEPDPGPVAARHRRIPGRRDQPGPGGQDHRQGRGHRHDRLDRGGAAHRPGRLRRAAPRPAPDRGDGRPGRPDHGRRPRPTG